MDDAELDQVPYGASRNPICTDAVKLTMARFARLASSSSSRNKVEVPAQEAVQARHLLSKRSE